MANKLRSSRLRRLRGDQSGAAMVEFSLIAGLLLLLTGGLVEFTLAFYQWNAASKAMHVGVRLASVSTPVSDGLKTLTDGGVAGSPWTTNFNIVCNGSSGSCSGGGNYVAAAMNTLVNGRDGVCGTIGADAFPGMCDIFPRIQAQNVRISYQFTGLGFAGSPQGPVPTITLELTGLTFNFVFLRMIPGMNSMTMPGLKTTATGEDLGTTWTP